MRSSHTLIILRLLTATLALAAQADITGWNGQPWGSPKPPSGDTIHDYRQDGVVYEVKLTFDPKHGLTKVTLAAPDDRESFQKALAALTARYGRPTLRSEYDGDTETTGTTWEWTKPHGKATLSADNSGSYSQFILTFERR